MESTVSSASPNPARALVIVVRGLSPFFCSPYGNEWVDSPTLDRLASRGVVFDQHYATHLKDHSIVDGLIKSVDHRSVTISRIEAEDVHARTRHSLLATRRELYRQLEAIPPDARSLVIVETDAISPPWDPPKRYLNYYFGGTRGDDGPRPKPWRDSLPTSVSATDDLTLERLQDTFAATMSWFDRGLAKLLTGARRRGFGQNALIAVTSDLAFPVGEQGHVGWHDVRVLESIVHLPLIVRLPEQVHAGMRVNALTQADDFVAMIRDYFAKNQSEGLWQLINGQIESLREHLIIRSATETAIRTSDRLAVIPTIGDARLFVKPDDRWELWDVGPKREEELETLVNAVRNGVD